MKQRERHTEILKREMVKDKGYKNGREKARTRRVGCANFQTACFCFPSTVAARWVEFCGNKLLVMGRVSLIKLDLSFPIQGTTQMTGRWFTFLITISNPSKKLGFKFQPLPRTKFLFFFNLYHCCVNPRPYGAQRPAVFKDLEVRTVHRGRHWRVKTFNVP